MKSRNYNLLDDSRVVAFEKTVASGTLLRFADDDGNELDSSDVKSRMSKVDLHQILTWELMLDQSNLLTFNFIES